MVIDVKPATTLAEAADQMEEAIGMCAGHYVPVCDTVLSRWSVVCRSVDVDALLELADEMGRLHGRCDFCINRGECDWADEAICLENMMDDFANRIREALGARDA